MILLAVSWYGRYLLSYRDVRNMLAGRGITVDVAFVHCWVRKFGPEMRKRVLCRHRSWRGLPDNQTAEIQVCVTLINRFNALGTAEIVSVA